MCIHEVLPRHSQKKKKETQTDKKQIAFILNFYAGESEVEEWYVLSKLLRFVNLFKNKNKSFNQIRRLVLTRRQWRTTSTRHLSKLCKSQSREFFQCWNHSLLLFETSAGFAPASRLLGGRQKERILSKLGCSVNLPSHSLSAGEIQIDAVMTELALSLLKQIQSVAGLICISNLSFKGPRKWVNSGLIAFLYLTSWLWR